MGSGPVIYPGGPPPPYATPLQNPDGSTSAFWWRFWSGLWNSVGNSGGNSGAQIKVHLNASNSPIVAPDSQNAETNSILSVILTQDSVGDRPLPPFTGGAGGFASDTVFRIQNAPIAYLATPNTQTILIFISNGFVWVLVAGVTGVSPT